MHLFKAKIRSLNFGLLVYKQKKNEQKQNKTYNPANA